MHISLKITVRNKNYNVRNILINLNNKLPEDRISITTKKIIPKIQESAYYYAYDI